MNLKLFDIYEGLWVDVSGQPGASLEYSEASGWVATLGYKKYVAIISQASSEDPTVIVLENTLGFIPDWRRDSAGVYGFDWDVDFNSNKCTATISQYFPNESLSYIEYNDVYNITLKASKGDDNIFKQTIEIRYYN